MTSFPLRPESELDNLPATAVTIDSGMHPSPGPVQTELVEIADYLKIIALRWRLVAVAALLGCVAGVMLTLVQTPSYRVKTSLEIQNINGEFLNMKQTRQVTDEAYGNDALIDMQTQIELLQSQSLIENTKRAMKQLGMKSQWALVAPRFGKSAVIEAGGNLSDKVLDGMAKSIKVRNVGATRVIQVQVDAPNPNLGADFANTLVSEFIHQNIRTRTQMTEAAEDWTREQVTSMRRKLENSEQALQRYASAHGLVFAAGQNISDDKLKQVQADLLRARSELADRDARRDVAATAKAETLPSVDGDTSLRELRAKLDDLKRQEAELLTVYKADYSEVKKVRAQAEQTQSALDRAQQRVISRIDNEYRESIKKERSLTRAYNEAVQQAASESQMSVQYDILKREVDANLSSYQDMLQKVKDLGLAAALRTSNVRIVDEAIAPKRANSPNLPLNVVLSLFTALSFAICYAVVSERSNQNLRHPGEAMVRLGVPELAVIPSIEQGIRNFAPLRLREQERDQSGGLEVFQNGDFDSYAPTTDAFRTILTGILLSSSAGKHPKSIVVTSASPQEGKTTVASNMALACARAGKRVLLIDGDLRSPQIHKLFGISNGMGLGGLLESGCDEEAAQVAVVETSVSRLSILTAGSFSAPPADLLFQPQLQSILRAYRKAFDIVLIDSPPILRVPDSRLLSRCTDGVIMVARSNRTNRNALVMACQRLSLDRSRVLGVVLNDWKGEPSPYPV
jgi:capsular exopolysaccharide synthesis family protein